MKCCIVYFSQTGNTEKIARRIQTGVISAAGDCDLLELRRTDPKHVYQYDLSGIGSPVFRWEPVNVGMSCLFSLAKIMNSDEVAGI